MTGARLERATARLANSLRHHFSSLASLATRAAGVGAAFVVSFLIGRWYGPEAIGQYAIVTQTAMFLSVIVVGGLDLAITRELSKAINSKVKVGRAVLVRILASAMAGAVAIIALMLVVGADLLRFLGRGAMPSAEIVVLCVILFARALTRLCAAILRSQKDYVLAQAVELLLIPLFTLALILLAGSRTVSEILWATALGGLLSAAIGLLTSMRHTGTAPDALRVPVRTVIVTAAPLWGVAVISNLADWYGLATVSSIEGVHQAGLYRVAVQFASLLSIVTLGLFGTFTAQISAAAHSGDKRKVARLSRSATRLSVALSVPPAIAMFIWARPLLELIGPEFGSATALLRLLLVGQMIYTVTGPCGLVLAITGHGKSNLAITLVSTAAIVVAAPLAAHFTGTAGVALVVSAVLVLRNVAALAVVRRLEGISVLTGRLREFQ